METSRSAQSASTRQWMLTLTARDANTKRSRMVWWDDTNEQVQRLFWNYQPPLLSTLALQTKEDTLKVATKVTTNFCNRLQRTLSDAETEAFVGHYINYYNASAVNRALIFLSCVAYTTWPMMKRSIRRPDEPPMPIPRWMKMVSVGRKIGKFGFIYICVSFTIYPIFNIFDNLRWVRRVQSDPKLADMNQALEKPLTTQVRKPATPNTYQDENQAAFGNYQQSIEHKAKSAWSEGSRVETGSQNEGFDQLNASPTNADLKNRNTSAWDRLRLQTHDKSAKAQHAPQHTDGWGVTTDEAEAKENGQTANKYGDSNADEDVNKIKAQAQSEFDDLLERERRGVDQGKR
ncbi:hypothetical protein CDD81_1562 [Ophiocordyceps australis]|uniref:Uncharacterized protein n=1 Tax=Ophiocordyceps australis TaxID=1399860 RepID=A0A2C5XVS8_9HYPO|nr:hypothetical protein CDD81_1562 [Ophiocordyceps australis]